MPDPQEQATRMIVRDEVRAAISEHTRYCPLASANIEARTRSLEIRFGTLVGFMGGSGLIGGTCGAALVKLLGG